MAKLVEPTFWYSLLTSKGTAEGGSEEKTSTPREKVKQLRRHTISLGESDCEPDRNQRDHWSDPSGVSSSSGSSGDEEWELDPLWVLDENEQEERKLWLQTHAPREKWGGQRRWTEDNSTYHKQSSHSPVVQAAHGRRWQDLKTSSLPAGRRHRCNRRAMRHISVGTEGNRTDRRMSNSKPGSKQRPSSDSDSRVETSSGTDNRPTDSNSDMSERKSQAERNKRREATISSDEIVEQQENTLIDFPSFTESSGFESIREQEKRRMALWRLSESLLEQHRGLNARALSEPSLPSDIPGAETGASAEEKEKYDPKQSGSVVAKGKKSKQSSKSPARGDSTKTLQLVDPSDSCAPASSEDVFSPPARDSPTRSGTGKKKKKPAQDHKNENSEHETPKKKGRKEGSSHEEANLGKETATSPRKDDLESPEKEKDRTKKKSFRFGRRQKQKGGRSKDDQEADHGEEQGLTLYEFLQESEKFASRPIKDGGEKLSLTSPRLLSILSSVTSPRNAAATKSQTMREDKRYSRGKTGKRKNKKEVMTMFDLSDPIKKPKNKELATMHELIRKEYMRQVSLRGGRGDHQDDSDDGELVTAYDLLRSPRSEVDQSPPFSSGSDEESDGGEEHTDSGQKSEPTSPEGKNPLVESTQPAPTEEQPTTPHTEEEQWAQQPKETGSKIKIIVEPTPESEEPSSPAKEKGKQKRAKGGGKERDPKAKHKKKHAKHAQNAKITAGGTFGVFRKRQRGLSFSLSESCLSGAVLNVPEELSAITLQPLEHQRPPLLPAEDGDNTTNINTINTNTNTNNTTNKKTHSHRTISVEQPEPSTEVDTHALRRIIAEKDALLAQRDQEIRHLRNTIEGLVQKLRDTEQQIIQHQTVNK